MRRSASVIAGLTVVAGSLALASPASAQALFDGKDWRIGEVAASTATLCTGPGTCLPYQVATARVDYQGPASNPRRNPRVGERFFVHLQTGVVFPTPLTDSYQMRVVLPEGVALSVRDPKDLSCAITDKANRLTRLMPDAECQPPTGAGVAKVLPPVELSRGEVAHFWFPVVAAKTFTANRSISLISTPATNPAQSKPALLFSSVELTVDAAIKPVVVPAAVNGFAAKTTGTKVALSWQRPSGPVTSYRLQFRAPGKAWKSARSLPAAAGKATWSRGKPGRTYYLRLAAVNRAAQGPWSKAVKVRLS